MLVLLNEKCHSGPAISSSNKQPHHGEWPRASSRAGGSSSRSRVTISHPMSRKRRPRQLSLTHRTHRVGGSHSRFSSSQSRSNLEKISQKSKTKQVRYLRRSGKRLARSRSATRTTSVLLQLLLKIEHSAILTQSLVGANARIASFGTQAGKCPGCLWASKTTRLRQIFLRRHPRAII